MQAKLIRNGAIDHQLREYFTAQGYAGQTARFDVLELASIERPGWVQVFRFQVAIRTEDGEWTQLSGSCRDDERFSSFDVHLHDAQAPSRPPLDTNHVGDLPVQQRARFGPLIYLAAAIVISAIGLLVRSLR